MMLFMTILLFGKRSRRPPQHLEYYGVLYNKIYMFFYMYIYSSYGSFGSLFKGRECRLSCAWYWFVTLLSLKQRRLDTSLTHILTPPSHPMSSVSKQNLATPKDARIADAIGEIGPSVLVGAATTFLGIMPMAFASNVISRVFFRMFLVIISFGVSLKCPPEPRYPLKVYFLVWLYLDGYVAPP